MSNIFDNGLEVYRSIVDDTATCLVKLGNETLHLARVDICSMVICNTASVDVVLDLYLAQWVHPERTQKGVNYESVRSVEYKHYILKSYTLTVGQTLILGYDELQYDRLSWELYFKTGASNQTADVKITTKSIGKDYQNSYNMLHRGKNPRLGKSNTTGSATDGQYEREY